MAELVTFKTFSYEHEAEFVKSLLEGSGIEASISGDDCGALQPALGMSTGVRVMVMSDRLEDAKSVVESAGLGLPPEDRT